MTKRMKGLRVCVSEFDQLVMEFTEHGGGDRWPSDYEDKAAQGMAKDGAVLVQVSVHRVACQAERARSAQRLRCWIPTSIDFLFLMLSKSQPSSRVGVEIYGYVCRHAGFAILAINTADKSESDGNVPGSR